MIRCSREASARHVVRVDGSYRVRLVAVGAALVITAAFLKKLRNIMKKASDTASGITQNIK